jgi:transcriptional regulator with XRE-family HTH domain
MGHARPRPRRLAEKLLQIRTALGLSQAKLHNRLGVEENIPYTRISDFELDKNEPSLIVLLEYARLAGVHLEEIVDDELDLPASMPSSVKYKSAKPKSSRKRRNPQK